MSCPKDQKIPKPIEETPVEQPQELEHHKEIMLISIISENGNRVNISSGIVDLTEQSPGQGGKSRRKHSKDLVVGDKIGTTEGGTISAPKLKVNSSSLQYLRMTTRNKCWRHIKVFAPILL